MNTFKLFCLASCLGLLISANSSNPVAKPIQLVIPINNESGILALPSAKEPSLQGFDIDSLNNIYFLQNDYNHKKSYILSFIGSKMLFKHANPFTSKKLFLNNETLLTGNFQGKTASIKFLHKYNASLIKSLSIVSKYIINDLFFHKSFIAIQYFKIGDTDASYEYYSYAGVKISHTVLNDYQGSPEFVFKHMAEGAFFVGVHNKKTIYSGDDLDNNISKLWLINLNTHFADSIMIKDTYLGTTIPDIQEFVKFRNNKVWFVRMKSKQVIVTSQEI